MHKPKIILSVAALLFISLSAFTDSFAQNPTRQFEPSYEVVLQIITASNAANDKTPVPQALSGVVKKLRNTYSFSGFHLDSTYLQRSSGSIEFKSISNTLNQNQDNFAPVFSDWSLLGLKTFPDALGKKSIQFQGFRFGQRVPIRTSAGVVNYENVGIKLESFSMQENVPTVIGSLSTAKPDDLQFLVLTVKPVDE